MAACRKTHGLFVWLLGWLSSVCRRCASKRTLRMVEEQQRRDGLWRLQGITHTDVDTHYLPPGLTFGQLSVRPHLGVGGGCWGTRASTHLTASMRPQVVRASVPRGSLISMLPRIAAAQAVPSLTTNASTTAPFGRLVTGMLSSLPVAILLRVRALVLELLTPAFDRLCFAGAL